MKRNILIGKNYRSKSIRGFSLSELSIVVLVIAIIIAGVLASNALIKKFRIQTAQTLTISSPVQGIPDSVLWLESSLDKSFKSSESSDTSSLSAWYDIRENVNTNNATQSNSSYYPTYSNSINGIQAVKFDGTNGYFTVDGSVLNYTNYTILVLEQRESNKSGNYFIGDSSSGNESATNKNLVLGYSADGTIKHSQSSDNSYTSSISSYSASSGKPRIFTFVHDKSSGKKTYINGLLAATSTDTNHLSGMTTLSIGKSYQGQLGEVVIFARALTTEERQSVEDYLGKKWNSKILRSIGSSASSGGIGGSCVGGIISNDSCLASCTVTAAIGITDTTVSNGSGSLTCNTSQHFTGSLAYTCINGQFSYTGATSCSCASGYRVSGSTCEPIPPTCSGGSAPSTPVDNYSINIFTSSGTLTCSGKVTADILVVAGGGAGGKSYYLANGTIWWGAGAGGGGAGGVLYTSSVSLTSGTSYTINVGSGGTDGNNGSNSSFTGGSVSLTAIGGGSGATNCFVPGWNSQLCQVARKGGSGGGGFGIGGTGGGQASGTSGQGNSGGPKAGGPAGGGGGGGGAGAVGGTSSTASDGGGVGGAGLAYDISGVSTYYGGGGAGKSVSSSSYTGLGASGGVGGGGRGATACGGCSGTNKFATSGTANTGGGGGGGPIDSSNWSSGGSGIVIVRYPK